MLVLVLSEAVLVIEEIVKNHVNRFARRVRAPSQATEHEPEQFRSVSESCVLIDRRGILCRADGSNVDGLGFLGSFHDETKAGRRVTPHQITDHAIRFQLVVNFDPQQTPGGGVECCFPQHLGHHFS